MSVRFIFRALLTALFIGVLSHTPLLAQESESAASAGSNWKSYYAYDRMAKKIMDGERYTYFWVHQNLYANLEYNEMYSRPVGIILYYDKQNKSLGVRPLADRVALSGREVRQAEYNVKGKYLMIIYTNGVIDLVYDDGKVYTLNNHAKNTAGIRIYSTHVSFPISNSDAYIATAEGFIHIDGASRQIAGRYEIGDSVGCVNRVGDQLLAIIDGQFYEAPATKRIKSLSDFKALNLSISNADLIMPVSSNAFVTLAGSGTTKACQLATVTRDANGNYSVALQNKDTGFYGQLSFLWKTADLLYPYAVTAQNEAIMQPNANGYMLISKTYAYQVDMIKAGEELPKVTTRKLPVNKPRCVGSYDFENFMFHTERQGFHYDKATGYDASTTWQTGDMMLPKMPLGLFNARMTYSPKYGLMLMNYGTNPGKDNVASTHPMLLSSYKNGEWKNLSPSYIKPAAIEGNATLENIWKSPTSMYPLANPLGIFFDPLYPNYMYTGAVFDGMVFYNLDNPSGQIIHFGAYNSEYAAFPGYKSTGIGGWGPYCSFVPAGNDADNNLWFYIIDPLLTMHPEENSGVTLWYLTPEARAKGLEAQNVAQFGNWSKLYKHVEGFGNFAWRSYGLALKHPSNKNTLFLTSTEKNIKLIRYNHNGTLDDASDDKAEPLKSLITDGGATLSFDNNFYALTENPVNGDIYLSSAQNIYTIHPNAEVIGTSIRGEVLSITNPDGTKTPVVPYTGVNNIQFDEYNRMWIATNSNGVIGVNADMTKVIARYDVTNSPLMSNHINDVCWNPDTQELFITTELGIMSMQPDAVTAKTAAQLTTAPYIAPQAVTPDFAGSVTIHNVPSRSTLVVENEKGKVIATLSNPVSNTVVWNLLDADGHPAPTGTYRIVDRSEAMETIYLPLLR